MKRREVFAQFGGIVALLTLAGCSGSGPNPKVVDSSVEGRLFGPTDFEILIENRGAEGNILVTVTTYDSSDSKLNSASKKVHFQEGQTRQVTISMEVSSRAEYWKADLEVL